MTNNARKAIRMTDDEVTAFLVQRHTMAMATLGPDHRIHLVAMWYGLLDGKVAVETKVKSQKVRNLRRDPSVTVLIETGDTYDTLQGVQIAGRAEIVEDRDIIFEVGKSVFERYSAPYTEEMRPYVERLVHNRVAIVVHPEQIVTWDHAKLP